MCARLVNYSKVRTTRIVDGKKVTRLLPNIKDFETLMQAAGLNKNDNVKLYDGSMHQWTLEKRPTQSVVER